MEKQFVTKAELIDIVKSCIDQTDNELDKQGSIRDIIDNLFVDKTYAFNKSLLFLILVFQYIPFLVLIFIDYHQMFDAITMLTLLLVLLYHAKVELM